MAHTEPETRHVASLPRFNVGFATDIGRKRTQNQDSLSIHPELGLFLVADGMGGHQGGETASAMAVEIIPHEVERSQQYDNWNPHDVITRAIRAANDAIFERALRTPQLRGMGTTVTALLFKSNTLVIGHVGDSRCYIFRQARNAGSGPSNGTYSLPLWQATRDHSLVQEKLRAGLITRAEIRTDRMKNVITRSVGFEKNIAVETYEVKILSGDVFLICSDGLSGLIQDSEIQKIVENELMTQKEAQTAVKKLIDHANHNGGDDNITSILIEIAEFNSPRLTPMGQAL